MKNNTVVILDINSAVGRGVSSVGWRTPSAVLRCPTCWKKREFTVVRKHENPKELSKACELTNGNVEIETMVLSASHSQNTSKIQSLFTSLLPSLWFKPPSSLFDYCQDLLSGGPFFFFLT